MELFVKFGAYFALQAVTSTGAHGALTCMPVDKLEDLCQCLDTR